MQIEVTVQSLSAGRIPDKLAREGVEVISARMPRKNVIVFRIAAKDRKKVFAILQGTCYNVSEVVSVGAKRRLEACRRAAGLLAGLVLFLAVVLFCESRVLRLEIVGSGAYYEREVREILSRGGVKEFSAQPRDSAPFTAEILSLPRVEFCAFRRSGGILTVEVRVSDDALPLPQRPLLSPAAGRVEQLVVIRGAPLVAVGDEVAAGQEVVSCGSGETDGGLVIARVTVASSFSREYAGEEREALAQARLEFDDFKELHTTKTERGWRVEGIALVTASVNLA